jgi:hypothetical protein
MPGPCCARSNQSNDNAAVRLKQTGDVGQDLTDQSQRAAMLALWHNQSNIDKNSKHLSRIFRPS